MFNLNWHTNCLKSADCMGECRADLLQSYLVGMGLYALKNRTDQTSTIIVEIVYLNQ